MLCWSVGSLVEATNNFSVNCVCVSTIYEQQRQWEQQWLQLRRLAKIYIRRNCTSSCFICSDSVCSNLNYFIKKSDNNNNIDATMAFDGSLRQCHASLYYHTQVLQYEMKNINLCIRREGTLISYGFDDYKSTNLINYISVYLKIHQHFLCYILDVKYDVYKGNVFKTVSVNCILWQYNISADNTLKIKNLVWQKCVLRPQIWLIDLASWVSINETGNHSLNMKS
eukprot:TRINITY_DN7652_c0_g2_i1.p1 TRINITY_DN7652_c0_g2~~TRINITY_DN7652_c0_g2_i1.p1  ORF type:complete len:225 (-),score=-4.10 TRINITY_DN7652_c0_g2_i1:150-824(-)